MMKFFIQYVRGEGARLGQLTELGRHGNLTIETPMCLLFTRSGSCPYLTCDMLKKITDVPVIAQMPLNQLAENVETLKAFKQGMANFSSLQGQLVYTSVQDPSEEVKQGYNDKSGVGVWGKAGKTMLKVDSYLELQEAIQPDWFESLCDSDTNKDSSRKRAVKAVDRTLSFLDEILDKMKHYEGKHFVYQYLCCHLRKLRVLSPLGSLRIGNKVDLVPLACEDAMQHLKQSCIFGAIVGGYNERERLRCVKETINKPVDGFVLSGFHNQGPQTENFDVQSIKPLLKDILKQLPADKPRIMHSVWRPDSLLDAVEYGIDIFDSSYAYITTEKGHAMTFIHESTQNAVSENDLSQGFTINLRDKRFFDDFSPLVRNCKCYACTKFTRSYISHLLHTSELLGPILLMMHNNHHYFQFFTSIRQALANDTFSQLKQLIQQQKGNHTES